MAARDFHYFIGVDLGGGRGKNTAVALLERVDGSVVVRHVGRRDPEGRAFYDTQLCEFISAHSESVLLAMGAPVTLTKCMRCQLPSCPGVETCDESVIRWFRNEGAKLMPARSRAMGKPLSTPYTQRACELILHRKHGVLPRETFGQGMGPLTARAHHLMRRLGDRFQRDANLIEVYPKATIHALFGSSEARRYKRGVDTWRLRAAMLERLATHMRFDVWREGCLQDDHAFDAVICAYTGYLWANEGWQLPEEHREIFEEDGWVWFPEPRE